MTNYLITGNTGSGKSTVASKLKHLGYTAIDTDMAYSHWLEHSSGKTHSSRPDKSAGWEQRYEWLWDEEKISNLLSAKTHKLLFLCGVASNQVKFYPCFDKIFLLETTLEIIGKRLRERDNNPFGKSSSDIEATLNRNSAINSAIFAAGAIKINSNRSVEKVVDEILSYVNEK